MQPPDLCEWNSFCFDFSQVPNIPNKSTFWVVCSLFFFTRRCHHTHLVWLDWCARIFLGQNDKDNCPLRPKRLFLALICIAIEISFSSFPSKKEKKNQMLFMSQFPFFGTIDYIPNFWRHNTSVFYIYFPSLISVCHRWLLSGKSRVYQQFFFQVVVLLLCMFSLWSSTHFCSFTFPCWWWTSKQAAVHCRPQGSHPQWANGERAHTGMVGSSAAYRCPLRVDSLIIGSSVLFCLTLCVCVCVWGRYLGPQLLFPGVTRYILHYHWA